MFYFPLRFPIFTYRVLHKIVWNLSGSWPRAAASATASTTCTESRCALCSAGSCRAGGDRASGREGVQLIDFHQHGVLWCFILLFLWCLLCWFIMCLTMICSEVCIYFLLVFCGVSCGNAKEMRSGQDAEQVWRELGRWDDDTMTLCSVMVILHG